MNFLLKSKPKNKNKPKYISIVVLFCCLFVLIYFFPQGTRSVVYFSSRPAWALKNYAGGLFKNIGGFFVSKNSLIKRNTDLENQLALLSLKTHDYDLILNENQNLKTLMGRPGSSSRILARILSKPPFSPYDTLVIDAGLNEGLSKEDKVFLSDDIIVGFLSDTASNSSLVVLFSSDGQKLEAVNARTGASFEISGAGGANFRAEVPKGADIVWGDIFEYPAINPSVLGSVYYIDTNSQSSFKTVYLKTPGNIFENKWVFVEKNK